MEWKDIFVIGLALASFIWSAYVFYRTRNDKKEEKKEGQQEKAVENEVELEKAHLTESATLRKELREMLSDANARIDKLEELLIRANERISDFQQTNNDLTYEKKILEREKTMLIEDLGRREKLFSEQMHSKDSEIESLQKRVTGLEEQVRELTAQHVSNG